jgi:hypothetical protein
VDTTGIGSHCSFLSAVVRPLRAAAQGRKPELKKHPERGPEGLLVHLSFGSRCRNTAQTVLMFAASATCRLCVHQKYHKT